MWAIHVYFFVFVFFFLKLYHVSVPRLSSSTSAALHVADEWMLWDQSLFQCHITTFPRRNKKQRGSRWWLLPVFSLMNRWILKQNTGVFSDYTSVITVSSNWFTRWYIYRTGFSSFLKTKQLVTDFCFVLWYYLSIHNSLDQQCLCCVHTQTSKPPPQLYSVDAMLLEFVCFEETIDASWLWCCVHFPGECLLSSERLCVISS